MTSDYELLRQQNIARNELKLAELGLFPRKSDLKGVSGKADRKRPFYEDKDNKHEGNGSRRRSSRLALLEIAPHYKEQPVCIAPHRLGLKKEDEEEEREEEERFALIRRRASSRSTSNLAVLSPHSSRAIDADLSFLLNEVCCRQYFSCEHIPCPLIMYF